MLFLILFYTRIFPTEKRKKNKKNICRFRWCRAPTEVKPKLRNGQNRN